MLEMLDHLRANGLKTYIVSGGGVEFMRAFAEATYGIPPEQVIGSRGNLKFELRDGAPALVKLAEIDFIDDKERMPLAIHKHIGHAPSPRSATPTATWRCCNGPPREAAPACASTSTTPTPSSSGPMTDSQRPAA